MALVFHVISGLKVGGAEVALQRLATASRGGPFRHVVASLSPDGAMRARFEQAGVELLVFDLKRRPLRSLAGLYVALRRRRPDVVQTWMYHADLIGGLLARLAGCRHVIWGVRATAVGGAGARATRLFAAACARLSSVLPQRIVCVAESARRSHMQFGYDGARMSVVPNGFEMVLPASCEDERARLRAACGIGPACIAFGLLGRFHPDKDQENFVAAAGLLARAHPDAVFLMVGRDISPANPQLMAWIAASGHAHRFVLLGERSDVAACMAAMDVFCLSSRTEGFPNVVGEAMVMGLPCVVTDAGDAALLVGAAGVVVPVGDPAALAAGMARLLAMGAEARRALGGAARARIGAEFTMERTRARYEAIYRQLMKKGQD